MSGRFSCLYSTSDPECLISSLTARVRTTPYGSIEIGQAHRVDGTDQRPPRSNNWNHRWACRYSASRSGRLEEAFNQTARRGVIVVAAAGNHGSVGSSAITKHPWVIPVVADDFHGGPMDQSNLGSFLSSRLCAIT
jgi:hypothetical protein